jgi:hypothetical protein
VSRYLPLIFFSIVLFSSIFSFICPSTEVFGTASIIWGVIGPQRQFSKGQTYYGLVFFFLIGAMTPVVPWLLTKKYPNKWYKYVNMPVIFNGTGLIPPASAVNYVPWAIVGFIFQYVIRRRHFSWWTKYNCTYYSSPSFTLLLYLTPLLSLDVLSAALDSGVAVSIVLIFFM